MVADTDAGGVDAPPAVTDAGLAAMCTACVAQGVTYVGGSIGALRLMGFRAARRRRRDDEPTPPPGAEPIEAIAPGSTPVPT